MSLHRTGRGIDLLAVPRDALVIDAVFAGVLAVQYIGMPAAAGLLLYDHGFFTWILATITFLSITCAAFFHRRAAANGSCVLLGVFSLLFLFIFMFFNGPFNVPLAITSIMLFALNGASLLITVFGLNGLLPVHASSRTKPWFSPVDWHVTRPRGKVAALFACAVVLTGTGIGAYTNWNVVITVQAPDGFMTTSSFWGPPSLSKNLVIAPITPVNNETLLVPGASGTLAYVKNVTVAGNATNFCNYTAGAKSYPNGTVLLSRSLHDTSNVSIAWYNVTNSAVLRHLNTSRSTLIMNHHSSGHPVHPNGYWYHEPDFFASIVDTHLFQLLDHWNVKYYLNVHNGIDFPHAFNYPGFVDLSMVMLDWFAHQNTLGLCTNVQGISPDFESGRYERMWWDNQTSVATPLYPGSLLPGIISQEEWWGLNCQDPAIISAATLAWEGVYTHASNLGYSTYVVFQDGAMRDAIDGDIDVSWLPTFPVSRNPTVRYGIMSYMDARDNIAGGRYAQYRDCVDQITLLGDQGRSILTGWIANGTRWYTDDALGLGRYIEDVLVAQAAGMTEIFHAPIYRLQGKWGDDAVLLLHQALNEWPKRQFRFAVPAWEYRANYNDALKNVNHWWTWAPLALFAAAWLLLAGTFKHAMPWNVKRKERTRP